MWISKSKLEKIKRDRRMIAEVLGGFYRGLHYILRKLEEKGKMKFMNTDGPGQVPYYSPRIEIEFNRLPERHEPPVLILRKEDGDYGDSGEKITDIVEIVSILIEELEDNKEVPTEEERNKYAVQYLAEMLKEHNRYKPELFD